MNNATPSPDRPTVGEGGFTLVELMVAMTIGLFLVAVLGYILLGAKQSFNTLDALSRIQEDARFAFQTMASDIREAGFTGGPFDGGTPVNAVNNPSSGTWDPNLKNLYGQPLVGYDEGGTFPTGVVPLRGDALTVVRADNATEFALASVASNCSGATPCTLATWPASGAPVPAPEAGEIFVAADYTHSAVFQATGVDGVAKTVAHATSGATPGNAVDDLGAFHGDPGARKLYRLRGATYYIANNAAGAPALYRMELGHSGTTASATATEVLEGVEDMQIQYGEDTTDEAPNPPVWAVTQYRTSAAAVTDWSKVLSVRITLTLVSRAGTPITATGDGLLRKTLTNTIAVRNRLL